MDHCKKSTQKINAVYLKYLDDIKTPCFGWSTTNNHRDVFGRAFPGVRVNMEVRHTIPQRVLKDFAELGIDPK